MAEKQVFSFRTEPKGDLYRALIDLGAQRCPTVLLVVRDQRMLGAEAQRILKSLTTLLIDAQEGTQWPGTFLHGDKAVVYRYRAGTELIEALKSLADGLYSWQHPRLPEDLCFLRSDGTPWLASIAHDGDAYLELTRDELQELFNLEPRLTKYVSAD
jgi:hypothetical protein